MTCPTCGAQILRSDASSCSSCGASLTFQSAAPAPAATAETTDAAWTGALSDDGHWRWNGTEWAPNNPPGQTATEMDWPRQATTDLSAAAHQHISNGHDTQHGPVRQDPIAGPPGDAPSRTTQWKSWKVALPAAALIAAAIVVGIVLNRGGSPSSDVGGGTAAGSDQWSNQSYVCQVEANVVLDVQYNDITHNQNSGLYSAIGNQSPVATVVNSSLSTFFRLVSQVGANDAETQIEPTLNATCQQNGNPILTAGQVQALTTIAPSSDSNLLSQVRIYQDPNASSSSP